MAKSEYKVRVGVRWPFNSKCGLHLAAFLIWLGVLRLEWFVKIEKVD